MMPNSSPLFSLFLICIGSILIGAAGPFVRLSSLDPLVLALYRMLLSLPLLALWMREETKEPLDYKGLLLRNSLGIIAAGLFFALDLGLWNWSVGQTSIVNSTLFNSSAALFLPFIIWGLYKQKPSTKILFTALIGFIGCVLLTMEDFSLNYSTLLGDTVALLSGLTVAFYIIALQQARTHAPTGFLMFWVCLSTSVFLALFSLLAKSPFGPVTIQDSISILGLALLIQVCGQGLFAYTLDKVPATYAGIALFLAPVTGALLGWALYDEYLSHLKLFGMALIMLSIFFIERKE